jgi:hypothetical protein
MTRNSHSSPNVASIDRKSLRECVASVKLRCLCTGRINGKASGCFMAGTGVVVREEPGKQKPRSCRAQELARSRAQEKCVAEKGDLTTLGTNRA